MASKSATWDAFDPLMDGLYCQAPCSDYDDVSDSTLAPHRPDKATIRRYEHVARRYLSGHAPLLITSTLRGPFDRASGFVNPWAKPIKPSRSTIQQSSPPTLHAKQTPDLYGHSPSPHVGETQTTESSYLPSPESLNLGNHPFLEDDEVARVQKWRDTVETNVPSREEFWASTTPSSTKRGPEDSSWLKRRAPKRIRTLEPGPKLSSPVSIPDKNARPQKASSPLSSLTSLGVQATPREPSSQATAGIKVKPDESTAARASQNALPSYSQRLSQRTSQSSRHSRLPPKSETSRIEKRHARSLKNAASKISKRTSPAHYAALAVVPQDGPLTTADSATESEPSQSTDDDVFEMKQEVMPEAADDEVPEIKQESLGPVSKIKQEVMQPAYDATVFVESDESINGQDMTEQPQPVEDRVLRTIDANAVSGNAEAESETSTTDGEDSTSTMSEPAVDASSPKPSNFDFASQNPSIERKTYKRALSNTPFASAPNPGLQTDEDNLGRRSQDKLASEHRYEDDEPTAAPDAAAADRSDSTSVTSDSSASGFAWTNPIEDGGHLAANDAQSSHDINHQLPEPAARDAAVGSQSKSDNSDDGQPQQVEVCSTSQKRHSTPVMPPDCNSPEHGTPDRRIATQQQSPWAKDPSGLHDDATSVEDGQSNGTLQEDERTQSFVVPAEAQSPWTQRPASQPQAAVKTPSSASSSPQLSPPSQDKQEDLQPQAEADLSNLTSDVSNTDFSIKSFSSFMSPLKPRPRASNSYLPHTPSLLAAATENPWQTSSKTKKRVSWAPLPHEVDSDLGSPAPSSSFSRASPPPAAPIPDDAEEDAAVFKNHFATVKRRTDPVRQRLLPSASQQTQRSPETEAMARAFVTTESPLGSSPTKMEGVEHKQDQMNDVAGGERMEEEPMDEVDDVLANLGDFLTTWDVETDLERARAEDRAGATATRGALDVEVHGW